MATNRAPAEAGADQLLSSIATRRGHSVPEEFAQALATVPRHLFLPDQLWLRDGNGGHQLCDHALDPERWWEAAYSDASLVTRFATASDGTREPSSSASAPSTVIRLLQDAQLTYGQRTLEIGTGTGFNTALLSALLGSAAVTSIEVDPQLAAQARENLQAASFEPTVVCADGTDGWAPGAPYDRILATCSVRTVPPAWLAQTRPGGLIVTPWDSAWSCYGTLILTKHADGQATGRFAAHGSYMLISSQRTDVELFRDILRAGQEPERRTTTLSPWAVAGKSLDLEFHLGLTVPGAWYSWDTEPKDGVRTKLWLADDKATSWASVGYDGQQTATFQVAQYGPRRLWDETETAHHLWLSAGKPTVDRYSMTIAPDGRATPWLDTPRAPLHG
ncbi:methyltransferase domain-containing protein [Streptomyces sp. NPDC004647]|uniref:methyltransferase domain-containing protein n=1 Tax=Streptomyces sp. NPDC004647 TaxID=3154671 RepID=UPI0033AF0FAB